MKPLGLDLKAREGTDQASRTPRDDAVLAAVKSYTVTETGATIQSVRLVYLAWCIVSVPVRDKLVRRLGGVLRTYKAALSKLVSLEADKITSESLGGIQEMIDICDFAIGLSRQLHGLTIASEHLRHRMMETWHPMGVVGTISVFNFPAAVWLWNAALALVCGNVIVWKPSERALLTAIACQYLMQQVVDAFNAEESGTIPAGLSRLLIGGHDVGEALVASHLVPVVSAIGLIRVGHQVGVKVAERFGCSTLELGGNSAIIIMPSVDLELTACAIAFAAVGTAGQRCTSLRRLIVHRSVTDTLLARLGEVHQSIATSDPLADGTLVDPLIDQVAFDDMQQAFAQACAEGGEALDDERVREDLGANVWYVRPALVKMPKPARAMETETFAPILYVMTYDGGTEQTIAIQNGVLQGLSSAIFTANLSDAERFMSSTSSDCDIINVNIGTSDAEIGGVLSGEKEVGDGREPGSDVWKGYTRHATNTVNHNGALPLAQGARFDI